MEQIDEDSMSATTDQAYAESPSAGFVKSEESILDYTQQEDSMMTATSLSATKQGRPSCIFN